MGDNGKRAIYTTTVRVRMTPEMYSEIKHISNTFKVNPSEVIRTAIKEYIKECDNGEKFLDKFEEFMKKLR